MECLGLSLPALRRKIDDVQRFLAIALRIANAHTVDFYTGNIWDEFIGLTPEDVLSHFNDNINPQQTTQEGNMRNSFGFSHDSGKLVHIGAFLEAAEAHSLPSLRISVPFGKLVEMLNDTERHTRWNAALDTDDFMNCKKAHEVQAMSEVVALLAQHCRVKQVIDVGSGKGYLSTHLSMLYGLQVFGIDSSSTNTHGAQERSRKLKRHSRVNQKLKKDAKESGRLAGAGKTEEHRESGMGEFVATENNSTQLQDTQLSAVAEVPVDVSIQIGEPVECAVEDEGMTDPFLSTLSLNAVEPISGRIPPSQLSKEERERRMRENLEKKSYNRDSSSSSLFLPLTSYVTAETELREVIPELRDAVMVGLHTCGDLASSTLRMFVSKRELHAICSVGCCYHLLSEEFDQKRGHHTLPNLITDQMQSSPELGTEVCGFPMSQYLRDQNYFCGRNARMSACLALERVTVGGGLPVESLFYRAVLHVILQDHYGAHKSEKRVGNVYSKASSFVDYIRRALRKLELDESKLSDGDIQEYHDQYKHRICEMLAFNRLKVTLAPCIEGLILLDRLCYLKEQENVSFCALVQLFDPVKSPRCYGLVALKTDIKSS
ncbi:methyltransferase-like protein 25 [Sardina pilchardus]|uniref:methyltransferase-like protein 25 n=1 Tax=Sardina pilchardus TaxID=27697 RepID=UPI002E13FC80